MSQKNMKKLFLKANEKWGTKYIINSMKEEKFGGIIPLNDYLKSLKIEDIQAPLTDAKLNTDGIFEINVGNETKEFQIYYSFIEDLFEYFELPIKNIISLPCTNWTNDINKLMHISHINNCTFRLKGGILYSFYPITTKTGVPLEFDIFTQCTKEIIDNIGEHELVYIKHNEYGVEIHYVSKKDRFDFSKLKSLDIETATAISVYESREESGVEFSPGASYYCCDRVKLNCLKIEPTILITKNKAAKNRKINLSKSKIAKNESFYTGLMPTKVIPKYAQAVSMTSGIKIELIINAISKMLVNNIKMSGLSFLEEDLPCSEKMTEFILSKFFDDDNKSFSVFDLWIDIIEAAVIFENDKVMEYSGNFLNDKFKFWKNNQ